MRRTKEEAEQTRILLLKSALHVISEKGFNAFRLSDVAEHVGLTRGAIYWHFGNKKELLIALFKERLDPFFEIFDNVIEEDITPLQKLEKIFYVFIKKLKEDKEFLENQQLDFMDKRMIHEMPEIEEYFQERGKKFFNMFTSIVQDGINQGEIRPIDPHHFSSLMSATIAGFADIYVKRRRNMVDVKNPEALFDIFINGLKNKDEDDNVEK